MFSQINTSLPSGDTLAQAMTKTNASMLDTARAICAGLVPGWDCFTWIGGGTIERPDANIWKLAPSYTYQVSASYGYDAGRIRTIDYQYTVNGGLNFTRLGILTLDYDQNGYAYRYLWSNLEA